MYEARQLVGAHLEARDLLVVANAEDLEAQLSQRALGATDLLEALDGDLRAVGKPRRQTRELRLVPRGQAQAVRPRADLVLRQPDVGEGRDDAVFTRGLMTGPVIFLVVGVEAIEHDRELVLGARLLGERVELGLAEVAAVRRVRGVARVIELLRVDGEVPGADLLRQRARLFGLVG